MSTSKSQVLSMILAIILSLLLVVLVAGIYIIKDKNNQTSELIGTLNNAAEEERLIRSVRTARNNSPELIEAFERIMLTSDTLVLFIEKIEETGQTLGLDINILSVNEEDNDNKPGLQEISIALDSRGSWNESLAFLSAIESLPHRITIEESSIERRNEEWYLRASLVLYSFD